MVEETETKRPQEEVAAEQPAAKKQKTESENANAGERRSLSAERAAPSGADGVFAKALSDSSEVRERAAVLLANALGNGSKLARQVVRDERFTTVIAKLFVEEDKLPTKHAFTEALEAFFAASWATEDVARPILNFKKSGDEGADLKTAVIDSINADFSALLKMRSDGSKVPRDVQEQRELVLLASLQLLRAMLSHVTLDQADGVETTMVNLAASTAAAPVITRHTRLEAVSVLKAIGADKIQPETRQFLEGGAAMEPWADSLMFQSALLTDDELLQSDKYWENVEAVFKHRPISRCLKLDADSSPSASPKENADHNQKKKGGNAKAGKKQGSKTRVFPEDWAVESQAASAVFQLLWMRTNDSENSQENTVLKRLLVAGRAEERMGDLLAILLDLQHLPPNHKELSQQDMLLISRITLLVSRLLDTVANAQDGDDSESETATIATQDHWSAVCRGVVPRLMDFLQQFDRSGQTTRCLLVAECVESCMHKLMCGIENGLLPQKDDLNALKRLAKCKVEVPSALLDDLDTAKGHAAVLLGVALPQLLPEERSRFVDPLLSLAESADASLNTASAALDAVFESFADDGDRAGLEKAEALKRLEKVREFRKFNTENEGDVTDEEDGVRENLTEFLAYLRGS